MHKKIEKLVLKLEFLDLKESGESNKFLINNLSISKLENYILMEFENKETIKMERQLLYPYLLFLTSNDIPFSYSINENTLELIGYCDGTIKVEQGIEISGRLKKEIEKEKKNQVFLRLYGKK